MNKIMERVKRIADAEITDAREYRDQSIKNFPGDKSMESMFRADCRDRVKAAQLAKKGEIDEAHDIMTGMDTAARDAVTDDFWNLIVALRDL